MHTQKEVVRIEVKVDEKTSFASSSLFLNDNLCLADQLPLIEAFIKRYNEGALTGEFDR